MPDLYGPRSASGAAVGGGSPAGLHINTAVLFNDGGSFGEDANFTWTRATRRLLLAGLIAFSSTTHAGIALNNLTTTQRDALTAPATGSLVHNTTLTRPNFYNGTAWRNVGVLEDANTWTVNGALSAPAAAFNGTWITGGSATTTKPYVLIEPTGTTSTGWSTSGTGLGVNAASGFVGNLIDLQVAGTSFFKIATAGGAPGMTLSAGGEVLAQYFTTNAAGSAVSIRSDTGVLFFGASNDVVLKRNAAATLQLGAADAATAVAQGLTVQSIVAGTTNTAGANWTLSGSKGTGTGAGGQIILRTAPAAASASTQNALATALTLTAPAINMQPSVVVGNQALATTATDGFLYIPSGAGPPTGVPTAFTGRVPLYYDSTNDQLYIYATAWKQPKTPAGAAIVTWQ